MCFHFGLRPGPRNEVLGEQRSASLEEALPFIVCSPSSDGTAPPAPPAPPPHKSSRHDLSLERVRGVATAKHPPGRAEHAAGYTPTDVLNYRGAPAPWQRGAESGRDHRRSASRPSASVFGERAVCVTSAVLFAEHHHECRPDPSVGETAGREQLRGSSGSFLDFGRGVTCSSAQNVLRPPIPQSPACAGGAITAPDECDGPGHLRPGRALHNKPRNHASSTDISARLRPTAAPSNCVPDPAFGGSGHGMQLSAR